MKSSLLTPFLCNIFLSFFVERKGEGRREMEEENYKKQAEEWQYQSMPMKSPEIVEIGEDSKSFTSSREGGFKDVYVAVGRDDLDVLKWALDHSASPQARIFLVHVFPPQTYISTPGNINNFFFLFYFFLCIFWILDVNFSITRLFLLTNLQWNFSWNDAAWNFWN